jgi:hypothetical protein
MPDLIVETNYFPETCLDMITQQNFLVTNTSSSTSVVKPAIMRKSKSNLVEKVRDKADVEERMDTEIPEETKKTSKDISDAVAELVEELDVVVTSEPVSETFDETRILYSLLDSGHKVMDYSKLEYGKIAEPLAIDGNYGSYKSDDGRTASSEETISMKEVDEIIHEKAFLDLNKASTEFIRYNNDERFKYWKLFNAELIKVKYEMVFN